MTEIWLINANCPRHHFYAYTIQTGGWANVGDEDGVPVWAANSLAFQAPGGKYKVRMFFAVQSKYCKDKPNLRADGL